MPYLPGQRHSGVFQGEARPLTRRRRLLSDRRPTRRYHRGRPARFADAGVARDARRVDGSRFCAGADCEAGRRTTAYNARELRRSAAQERSYGGLGRGLNQQPTGVVCVVWCGGVPAGLSHVGGALCCVVYVCITHETVRCDNTLGHTRHNPRISSNITNCDLAICARPPPRNVIAGLRNRAESRPLDAHGLYATASASAL